MTKIDDMKTTRLGMVLPIVVLAGSLHAHAQDAKAAEAFMTRLYQKYHTQKDFSPFGDLPTTHAIATPSLSALLKQDQETSAAVQDEGALDMDPVSGSQDSGGLQLTSLKVQADGPGKMLATADLLVQKERVTRRFTLLAVKGEWRIDNITDGKGGDDLRAALARSIASHKSTRKH